MVSDGNNNVVRKYTGGLDLAGQCGAQTFGLSDVGHGGPALQGAGGIGGLLAVNDPNDPGDPNDPVGDFVYLYDGNGNVSQVVNWSYDSNDPAGAIVARYEYDPYGRRINYDPNTPEYDQPWRFSTKRFDAETGWYDFDLRLCGPAIGRWTSHDPIEEEGGANLYAYVGNCPIHRWDAFGFQCTDEDLIFKDPENWPRVDRSSSFPDYYVTQCTQILGRACEKYKCCRECCENCCKRSAAALCASYVKQFRSKIKAWGGYQQCGELSGQIAGFNLSNGCFSVHSEENPGLSHVFAAVFHVCNKGSISDANLDPWHFMPWWGSRLSPYKPECHPGTPVWRPPATPAPALPSAPTGG